MAFERQLWWRTVNPWAMFYADEEHQALCAIVHRDAIRWVVSRGAVRGGGPGLEVDEFSPTEIAITIDIGLQGIEALDGLTLLKFVGDLPVGRVAIEETIDRGIRLAGPLLTELWGLCLPVP